MDLDWWDEVEVQGDGRLVSQDFPSFRLGEFPPSVTLWLSNPGTYLVAHPGDGDTLPVTSASTTVPLDSVPEVTLQVHRR
jgi:hypothetical protein